MSLWGDTIAKILWVGLGGALGANARYWLGYWVERRWGAAFPWGTFVVNITGCFILGFFVAFFAERISAPRLQTLRLLVAVGFVGAYTTFSTWEYDTFALMEAGALWKAFGNAFGSLVAGFVAVWLGGVVGRAL